MNSLTLQNVGRYDYLASKEVERKNSGTQRKSAPVRLCGFFAPAQFMGGRATDKTPERERSPLGCVRVLNLLPASRVARKNVLVRSFKTHTGAFIMSNTISIGSSEIRQIDGLYSLNDLHKASGRAAKHRPGYFLTNDQTKALIAEIQIAGIPAITAKPKIGTYASKELVIAYAAWISPAFHLKVIRVFLAQVGRTLPEPETINKAQQGEIAQLMSDRFSNGKDRPYAWSRFNNHFRLASYKDLPASKFDEACAYIANMTPPALPKPDADIARQIAAYLHTLPTPTRHLPKKQADEILVRLNRVSKIFHPFSDQFGDLNGVVRLLQGLNPDVGRKEKGYVELIAGAK